VNLGARSAHTDMILLWRRLGMPRWDGSIFIFKDILHYGGHTFFALESIALNAFEALSVWLFSKHPVLVLQQIVNHFFFLLIQ
jgi:hypothetical protein